MVSDIEVLQKAPEQKEKVSGAEIFCNKIFRPYSSNVVSAWAPVEVLVGSTGKS